jgi:nicotinate-nucleotide adenylyltransferase
MRIALLGGSFDPLHSGHLLIAEEAAARFGYDRVILVPASVSPLKAGRASASPEDRLAMLSASVRHDRRFQVDDCELKRKGVSYSIDTVLDIERRYRPTGKLGLIIGEDLVAGFPKWKRVDELVAKVDLLLASRPGSKFDAFPYPHTRMGNAAFDISSSLIRRLIEQGEPWKGLLPLGARILIEERNLYGFRGGAARPLRPAIDAVEDFALRSLSPGRYLHSRGVALLAHDLCLSYGLDADEGYLAGIGHDICKELPPTEILDLASRDGLRVSPSEKSKPSLLHARAGARFLSERFFIDHASVIEAVRCHTFGSRGMGPLAKIVYIADKIEPSRTDVSPTARELARDGSLQALFIATVEDTVRYLGRRRKQVYEETTLMLAEAKGGGL